MTKPLPLYPSDEIPAGGDGSLVIGTKGKALERGKGTVDVPVIGFIFCSSARSFDASCHSLVSVFGGGAAVHPTMGVSTCTRRDAQSDGKRRTICFESEGYEASYADESHGRQEDFQPLAWWADGCSRPVRSKCHVVSYPSDHT